MGNFTCKDTSVIDYCIGNMNFLSIVDKFEVLPFSCLSSDVHNALFIELNGVHSLLTNDIANTENNNHVHRKDQISVNRWKDDKETVFSDSILNKISIVNTIADKLLTTDSSVVDCNFIDDVTNDICNIFVTSAREVFGTMNASEEGNTKKYFFKNHGLLNIVNLHAKTTEKQNKGLKKYSGDIFKNDFHEKERLYKKTIKRSVASHNYKVKEKLRYLRTKNPRDYWKIINNGNVKPKHSVPIDDLFEFFKALNDEVDNTLPDHVAPMDDLDLLSGVNINVDINVCITVCYNNMN